MKMPPRFPAKRTAPPVQFKSETKSELATRMDAERTSTAPSKPLSNKEIALVLLVSHVEDSFLRLTDVQMATVAGKNLKGSRPEKIREMYRQRVEKLLASAKKLLTKRGHHTRISSFVSGGANA